ncbi:hypothetical protein AGLY_007149 [Aphis glycines]|uniref:Uncharacterized protein n=1 Tax=Aphis glycines TaxID=307491 RepID=A0A6G0TR18_APHGL|nr:hypothetical protein AGLY_007149 [Aphis glycines]
MRKPILGPIYQNYHNYYNQLYQSIHSLVLGTNQYSYTFDWDNCLNHSYYSQVLECLLKNIQVNYQYDHNYLRFDYYNTLLNIFICIIHINIKLQKKILKLHCCNSIVQFYFRFWVGLGFNQFLYRKVRPYLTNKLVFVVIFNFCQSAMAKNAVVTKIKRRVLTTFIAAAELRILPQRLLRFIQERLLKFKVDTYTYHKI